jgi:hypothetical protein
MRWTQRRRKTGGAEADGEVVWSWRPDVDTIAAEIGISKRTLL